MLVKAIAVEVEVHTAVYLRSRWYTIAESLYSFGKNWYFAGFWHFMIFFHSLFMVFEIWFYENHYKSMKKL